MSFIEEHCLIFDNEEENKLEYTTIHMVSHFPRRYTRVCLAYFVVQSILRCCTKQALNCSEVS